LTLILCCVSLPAFGQSLSDFNTFNFDTSLTTTFLSKDNVFIKHSTSILVLENESFINELKLKKKLSLSLENYVLDINHQDYSSNGVFNINFKNIRKFTLEDYYGEYNNDLSRYIQRAPDIMELCPIY